MLHNQKHKINYKKKVLYNYKDRKEKELKKFECNIPEEGNEFSTS